MVLLPINKTKRLADKIVAEHLVEWWHELDMVDFSKNLNIIVYEDAISMLHLIVLGTLFD